MGEINNKKYHFTDDGKIYRINGDGSFTEVYVTEVPDKESVGNVAPKRPVSWSLSTGILGILLCVATAWAMINRQDAERSRMHMYDCMQTINQYLPDGCTLYWSGRPYLEIDCSDGYVCVPLQDAIEPGSKLLLNNIYVRTSSRHGAAEQAYMDSTVCQASK